LFMACHDLLYSLLSFGTYSHLDPATNIELTCDKCPAGAYVSKHCTMTSLRECSHCASGTFTKHENGIESCHLCRKPCEPPMVERIRCTALTDRECACPSGSFLDGKTCTPYSVCPIGWGVRKKGSETEDVKCKPCPRGTFSDVPSSVLRCKMFTNCTQNNLTLLIRGTKERDNICGFQSTTFPPKGWYEALANLFSTANILFLLQDCIQQSLSTSRLNSAKEPPFPQIQLKRLSTPEADMGAAEGRKLALPGSSPE
uniref:TNF receptor superfamily member 21 n=1 Tax=Varanus komodoensis TaxID=61221 RepID=A0A8D2L7T6_VARKO